MFLRAASDQRPYHLGPFPFEELPRDRRIIGREAALPPLPAPEADGAPPADPFGKAVRRYRELFAQFATGQVAPAQAPTCLARSRSPVPLTGFLRHPRRIQRPTR